jgi:hypothetical protein
MLISVASLSCEVIRGSIVSKSAPLSDSFCGTRMPEGRDMLFILAILSKINLASAVLPLEQRYRGDSGVTP